MAAGRERSPVAVLLAILGLVTVACRANVEIDSSATAGTGAPAPTTTSSTPAAQDPPAEALAPEVLLPADPATGLIEAMHVFAGAISCDRNRIASNGVTIWLTTFDDRVLSFGG